MAEMNKKIVIIYTCVCLLFLTSSNINMWEDTLKLRFLGSGGNWPM